MEVRYFVTLLGKQAGPFTIQELRSKAASAEITRVDRIWMEGMTTWQPIESVPEIFEGMPPALIVASTATPDNAAAPHEAANSGESAHQSPLTTLGNLLSAPIASHVLKRCAYVAASIVLFAIIYFGYAFLAQPIVVWSFRERNDILPEEFPARIPKGLTDVISVAAGSDHIVALRKDGSVVSWQAHQGPSYRNVDARVLAVPAALKGVTAIAAAGDRSLALKSDGTVAIWGGRQGDPPLTVPPGLSDVVAIAAGPLVWNAALQRNGTVVVWSDYDNSEAFDTRNIKSIAVGDQHLGLVNQNGAIQLIALGKEPDRFNLANVPAQATGIKQLLINKTTALALTQDGRVIMWGNYLQSNDADLSALNDIRALVSSRSSYANQEFNLALKADGSVASFANLGDKRYSLVPPGLRKIKAIAAGDGFAVAVRSK